MKGMKYFTFAFMLLFLCAFQKDNSEKNVTFLVRHHLKGNNLFVECIIPEISFRNDNKLKKTGKLVLYIDGKLSEEIYSPVFIIKGLPSGKHHIILEVVNLNNQSYPLKQNFNVQVP